MACIACGRNFHCECETGCEDCHGEVDKAVKALTTSGTRTGHFLPDDKVTDVYSTGRKRAASLYPLDRDLPCEWRGLKNCGGGLPIVGCINGYQQDRHHGPDKTTINNEPGNVHRICKKCHKRWHFINDPVYNQKSHSETAHEPEEALEEELRRYETQWIATKRGHVNVEAED